jgi:hypothetical protein
VEQSVWFPGWRKNSSGKAIRQGHKVTLFASGGSQTEAELVVCAPQSLRLAGCRDHLGSTLAMLREVRRRAGDFDIIHFHVDLLPQALRNVSTTLRQPAFEFKLGFPDFGLAG